MTALLLVAAAHAAPADALLLGNSYTQFGDLDARVAEALLATVPGVEPPLTRKLTAGGLRLPDHVARLDPDSGDPQWLEALGDGATWPFVVLQDQSQVPGFPQDNPTWQDSRDAAVALDAATAGVGGQTLLFVTWGRRHGDATNPDLYPDFSTMQGRLLEGYQAFAAAIEAAAPERPPTLAPVGPAFAHIHDALVADGADPTADGTPFSALYDGDGSHPSRAGTALAAHVIAASMSGWPATGASLPGDLEPDLLAALQEAADAVVVDDPFGPWGFSWAVPWEAVVGDDRAPSLGHAWQRWQVGVAAAAEVDQVELKDTILRVLDDGALTLPDALCSGASALVVDGGAATLTLSNCAVEVVSGTVAWAGGAATAPSLTVEAEGTWRVGPDRPALSTGALALRGALALDDGATAAFPLATVATEPILTADPPAGWALSVAEAEGAWAVTLAPEDPEAVDSGDPGAGDTGAPGVQPAGGDPAGCGCGGGGAAVTLLLPLALLRRRRPGG